MLTQILKLIGYNVICQIQLDTLHRRICLALLELAARNFHVISHTKCTFVIFGFDTHWELVVGKVSTERVLSS